MPRSLGGGGGQNIAVACLRCNNARGSDTRWVPWRTIPEWRRRVGEPMRYVGDDLEPCIG